VWAHLRGAAALCCLAIACNGSDRAEGPPNVVLISIDSLRADHLGSYGYERETSPHIDRLASQGIVFENAIADSPWTLPTHASLFTGLTSRVHRVTFDGRRLDPLRTTLAEVLSAAGYQTRGLWSGPYLHPIFGFDQGFAAYGGVVGPLAYDDPQAFAAEDPVDAARLRRELNRESHRTVTSPTLTRKALEFLAEPHERPFFLFLHYFDVHYDYLPPEEIWRRFDPDYEGKLTSVPFSSHRRIHRDMPERELLHLRALYDGEIFFTDHYVGRVLEALDEHGLSERTLVVLTADHGEEFFEHGEKGHRKNLFDEVMKVPLLLRWPGELDAGRRLDTQVALIDVLPTILELVGQDPPEEVQGRSLAPLLRGEALPPADVLTRLVLPGTLSSVALRTPEWKLIVRDDDTSAFYDLASDPREQRSLEPPSSDPRLAEARARLARFEAEESRLLERLPTSDVEIELPPEMREALDQLGYGE
jgi:arylsulfatase A-like enzyme